MVDLLEFPMLLDGFSAEERRNIQVYLSENGGNYRKIDDDLVEVTSAGIQIYYREILKKGQNYQICAVSVSYTHLDVYKRQVQRLFENVKSIWWNLG